MKVKVNVVVNKGELYVELYNYLIGIKNEKIYEIFYVIYKLLSFLLLS